MQRELAMIKMKTLMMEQPQDSTMSEGGLLDVLEQYKSIFGVAIQSVESLQYDIDTEDILRKNAITLLKAYVDYLDATRETFNTYGDSQNLDDIILDATGGIKTSIDSNLEY